LRIAAESVGMACVNDGATPPKYCLPDFYDSLYALNNKLWPLMDEVPFGPEQVKGMEKVLNDDICSDCIDKLFDYMYMSWEDADDADKHLRVYMELACSTAPDSSGNEKWCLPVEKDMNDMTEPVLDKKETGYDQAKVDAYVVKQGELWCEDLCVKIINSKYKDMNLIDLYSNQSWTCGNKQCSQEVIREREKSLEREEAFETIYCQVVSYGRMHAQTCTKRCKAPCVLRVDVSLVQAAACRESRAWGLRAGSPDA
jgi:hypothetical protein